MNAMTSTVHVTEKVSSHARVERGFAPARGGRLYFERHGVSNAGIPALLLRPVGGTVQSWGDFRDRLASCISVITFDQRGSGASSRVPPFWTTRRMARDAVAVLNHLGVHRAHLFGTSLGGMVATCLAIDYPQRVGTVVLASTPPRGVLAKHLAASKQVALARCWAREARNVDACLVRQPVSPPGRDTNWAKRLRRKIRRHASGRGDLLKLIAAGFVHDVRHEIDLIDAPTLILAGEHDDLVAPEIQRHFASELTHGSFDVVPGAGHDLSTERPDWVAARSLAFWREHSADARVVATGGDQVPNNVRVLVPRR